MTSKWKIGLLLTGLAACTASSFAQMPRKELPPPMGARCDDGLIQVVGLSSDQVTALETLRHQTGDQVQPIAQKLDALRQQTETALAGSSVDHCAIGDLEIQAYGLRNQIQAIQKNAEAAFVASLSADQQAKYAAFIASKPMCAAIQGAYRIPRQGPPRA